MRFVAAVVTVSVTVADVVAAYANGARVHVAAVGAAELVPARARLLGAAVLVRVVAAVDAAVAAFRHGQAVGILPLYRGILARKMLIGTFVVAVLLVRAVGTVEVAVAT